MPALPRVPSSAGSNTLKDVGVFSCHAKAIHTMAELNGFAWVSRIPHTVCNHVILIVISVARPPIIYPCLSSLYSLHNTFQHFHDRYALQVLTKGRQKAKEKERLRVEKDEVCVAHVRATFNNTFVTITRQNGDAMVVMSTGRLGFKKAKRSMSAVNRPAQAKHTSAIAIA